MTTYYIGEIIKNDSDILVCKKTVFAQKSAGHGFTFNLKFGKNCDEIINNIKSLTYTNHIIIDEYLRTWDSKDFNDRIEKVRKEYAIYFESEEKMEMWS